MQSPASDTLKIGIIGLGKRGILHAALANMNPGAELEAICDTDEQLGKYLKNLGLRTCFFRNLDEMLKEIDLDGVFICTPNSTHLPLALKCSEKNLNIFVETPLAESYESAKLMMKIASEKSFVHSVGYHFPYVSVYQEAKRLLRSRILDNILRFRASLHQTLLLGKKRGWIFEKSQAGGGVVVNTATSLLYLLSWIFGPVESLYAKTTQKFVEVEDSASAILEFSSGVMGLMDISWSRLGYPFSTLNLIIEGRRGTMEICDDYIKLHLYEKTAEFAKGWITIHRADLPSTSPFFLGQEGLYEENSFFIESCRGKNFPLVTWKEGLEVLKIAEAIYLSAQTNRPIYLNEVK